VDVRNAGSISTRERVMRIKLGKAYKTRDGRKVVVIGYDPSGNYAGRYPFTGSIGDHFAAWNENGVWSETGFSSPLDLVAEWGAEPKVVGGVDPSGKDETVIVSGVYKDGGLRIETSELSTESARPMKLKISDLLPKHKYADTNREEDETIFHSEQATTVFRWLDPCDEAAQPPVLQQKFIVYTKQNASDQPLKTIEWRTIPLVEG